MTRAHDDIDVDDVAGFGCPVHLANSRGRGRGGNINGLLDYFVQFDAFLSRICILTFPGWTLRHGAGRRSVSI